MGFAVALVFLERSGALGCFTDLFRHPKTPQVEQNVQLMYLGRLYGLRQASCVK